MLNSRLFRLQQNQSRHFSTVLIRTNWYTISCKYSGCSGLTSIEIPNSVTSIGNGAFLECTGLTSFTIPNSVTTIGEEAFEGCNKLHTIVLGNNIQSIGYRAFSNCPKINDVYCYTVRYPSTDREAFYNSYPDYITLHVAEESVNPYKNVSPWNTFRDIVPLTDSDPQPTGIQELRNGKTEGVKYYDLNGNQSSQARKGLNIVRMSNGKTKKVLVK